MRCHFGIVAILDADALPAMRERVERRRVGRGVLREGEQMRNAALVDELEPPLLHEGDRPGEPTGFRHIRSPCGRDARLVQSTFRTCSLAAAGPCGRRPA